ncbi:glutathione S-transferase [Roseovarius sp. TE539]|uniref:glutathione S-transferase family protein n=1 Tax=Roseovarius sp. TE539 TaxID=2249812 RepID=UPI000DE18018|nr:glutathione S-transferase family protein [Roseovarius sp. TE539]RBI74745.1 glutathione S-transferase [Roseovarius sp. TE539]
MTQPYRLHYAPDNASLVVRLALESLGLPYETALVDRAARAQKSPTYLALNPGGLIPVLETPDGPIFETAAILLWLADRHAALAPAPDSPDRAGFLKWLFFAANTLHPALRITFYPDQYIGPDTDAQDRLRTHMQAEAAVLVDRVEALAAKAPPWLGDENTTVLDFYIACLLRWAALYPKGQSGCLTLRGRPALLALVTRLEASPAVRAAALAEGLGAAPFSAPQPPAPPEGSAT